MRVTVALFMGSKVSKNLKINWQVIEQKSGMYLLRKQTEKTYLILKTIFVSKGAILRK